MSELIKAPKVMKVKRNERYRDRNGDWQDNWVEIDKSYYSLGQVREAFAKATSWHEIRIEPVSFMDNMFLKGTIEWIMANDGDTIKKKASILVAINITEILRPVKKGSGQNVREEDKTMETQTLQKIR